MDSDIYSRLIRELREVERKWVPRRIGSIQTTTGGGDGYPVGVLAVGGNNGMMPGVLRAMSDFGEVRRVNNVRRAIDDSFPAAFDEITKKLHGISIDAIKSILREMLTDIALYLGGSTALGAGIGGGLGSLAGGIGAFPGVMVGGWLGFEIGNVLMALTGLKSVVVFMKEAVPAAIRCYGRGFRDAWGEPTNNAPYASFAWKNFAQGHVLFLMALLMGIVAYLTRGKGDFGALLTEIRASKKLGPKMAEWIEANKDDLLKNPELQPKASAGGGGAKAPAMASQAQGPTRGSSTTGGRPSWQKSEQDVAKDLGATVNPQQSYLNGKPVAYGTKGSVRPDFVTTDGAAAFEVKNYNIATNSDGLINKVSEQVLDRADNLPQGMTQKVIIDVRGQAISPQQEVDIAGSIVDKTDGAIDPSSIFFKKD